MKRHTSRIYLYTLLAVFLGTFMVACDDEEKYSSSPSHVLTFSSDTIKFDTVFTTLGSSTAIFKVFNYNGESLNIPSISLASRGNSGFRVNVDGMPGTSFTDVEIRKRDSMFVFVEVTVDPRDENNPFLLRDSLVFSLASGVRQYVQLEAYGQDMIILRGTTLDENTTFTGDRPYVVYDSLCVAPDVTLTLEEGTRLHFHSEVSMQVYGTLLANGTLERPVVFRGDRLDNMFSYLPYDRLDNQWGGITLHSTSVNNVLNYVDIHSGNYGLQCDSSGIETRKLKLENSIIHNVAGNALSSVGNFIYVGNTQLTNAGSHCVYLEGGQSQFIFCTIANFYPWSARGAALRFSNLNCDLVGADFLSCIITGYSSDEIMGQNYTGDDAVRLFEYRFSNGLLNTVEPTGEEIASNFIEVTYDDKDKEINRIKNFPLIDTEIYYYNFELDSASPAIGIGSFEDAINYYPNDRLGRSRVNAEKPDAGAYQYTASSNEE